MSEPLVRVTFDEAKLRAVERTLAAAPKLLPRIMYRALKRTAAGGRTQLDREIRRRILAKKRDVMNRIADEEKASYTNWRWRLGIDNRRLAITAFPFSPRDAARFSGPLERRPKGVRYTIRRGQSKILPHGFVRDMRRSQESAAGGDATYKAVFERADAERGRLVPRYPIVFLRGPSIGRVVTDAPELLQQVHAEGAARLEREIDGQVKYELERRWPR